MTEANNSQTQYYYCETLDKMYSMAYFIEYFENPKATVEKWGIDFSFNEIDGKKFNSELFAKNLSAKYNGTPCRYKDVLQIIDGLSIKNKDTAEIIALYYFVNDDSSPLDRKPFTDDDKEDIVFLAGLVDAFYTTVRKNTQKITSIGTRPESPELDKFLSDLTVFAYFLEYFEDEDNKPKIPAGSTIYLRYTDNTPLFNIEPENKPAAIAAEAQPRQLELPPLVPYISQPRNYIIANSLLINDLESGKKPRIIQGKNEYDLSVFGDKSDLTTYITISYEPDEDSGLTIKGPERLTAYERTVFNGIASLWEAAHKEGNDKPVVTPAMIYKAMPGSGDRRITSGQKGAIVKAINKFRLLHIEIDATDEMHKRKKIGPKEKFTLDSYCLLCTHVQRKAQNGYPVEHAYRIEAEPIILTYSRAAGQLLSIRGEYIDIRRVIHGEITKKAINMSEDRQAITDYLLRRIAIIKNDARNKRRRQSNNILFESLFADTGRGSQDRYQEKDFRNFCFDVLDYQTAAGNIKGYKKIIDGRKITGIEILL